LFFGRVNQVLVRLWARETARVIWGLVCLVDRVLVIWGCPVVRARCLTGWLHGHAGWLLVGWFGVAMGLPALARRVFRGVGRYPLAVFCYGAGLFWRWLGL